MAAAGVAEYSRWLHYGLTSNDVVDTAQALQIAERVRRCCCEGMRELLGAAEGQGVRAQAARVMIGRTHGIHAEPYTFGLKFALWYDELRRDIDRFERAADDIRTGKISGAVGTFAHIGPEAEERICAILGLRPARDRVAGDFARPARGLYQRAGAGRRAVREDRAGSPAPAAHGSSGGRGAVRGRTEGLVGDAAQAESRHLRADLRTWREWCGPTCRRRTKTSLSGTSATFRTLRSSA